MAGGFFLQNLAHKAETTGRTLITANRYPTSIKLCSICGAKPGPTSTTIREWTCPCGAVLDRDYNASTNLLMLAVAAAISETKNACGPDLQRQLAGVSNQDETGTHPDGAVLARIAVDGAPVHADVDRSPTRHAEES